MFPWIYGNYVIVAVGDFNTCTRMHTYTYALTSALTLPNRIYRAFTISILEFNNADTKTGIKISRVNR